VRAACLICLAAPPWYRQTLWPNPPRVGQLDTADAPAQQVDAHLVFEVADLPAQRGLRSV
jgi:hypothetical protein